MLAILAALAVSHIMPMFRIGSQNAAWEEARVAADAGVDAAIGDLLQNAVGNNSGSWPGWKQNTPGGGIGPVLSTTLNTVNSLLTLLLGGTSTTLTVSDPIFLDNVTVSAAGGVPTQMDVQLWALHPTASPQIQWFRIRSMATCGLPPTTYAAQTSLDTSLRRLSLRKIRPQIQKDDVGVPMTIPPPSVSRVVEVLVQPILPFELALWTDQAMTLGMSSDWEVDSYDSRDPRKSGAGGTYPGSASPNAQANGNIGSNLGRPASSLYGPLINLNGIQVRGVIATNGGDDPQTPAHENVTGAMQIDPSKIRDNFCREMRLVTRPPVSAQSMPPAGQPLTAGPASAPTAYLAAGDLGGFTIAAPLPGQPSAVIIMINGGLSLTANLVIPPGVTALVYVLGNVNFQSYAVNSGSGSSNLPAQLQIYGEYSGLEPRSLQATGSATICAAFYGPSYSVRLAGGVDWCGAIASHSFAVRSGGSGGVHYDEALGLVGPTVSFRIARYVEDVRE
jgi:hypothetical protein